MTKQELINDIIDNEWIMFHNVNGDERTDCQDDRRTFEIMRRGQYEAWSEETVACYREDILKAKAEGRNLAREKYIRMMKTSDPKGYDVFKAELPEMSPEKEALVTELWEKFLTQTLRMREKYPFLAMGGRVTRASEETNGWPSLETYQTCETMTYSEATLKALLADFNAKEAQGIDLVFEIQKNSVMGLGFKTMDEAEESMKNQILRELSAKSGSGCCCCGY